MSKEYPCVHYENGTCRKFTNEDIHSFCVEAPCPHQQMTNADRFRSMTDEELVYELSNRPCPGCPLLDTCTSLTGCADRLLHWLKQPYRE